MAHKITHADVAASLNLFVKLPLGKGKSSAASVVRATVAQFLEDGLVAQEHDEKAANDELLQLVTIMEDIFGKIL